MKPVIGIATDPFSREYTHLQLNELSQDKIGYYWLLARLTGMICSSVADAGGIPVLLEASDSGFETIASSFDGFVFAGGDDIDPSFYGETDKGSIAPNIIRDRFELGLIREAIKKEKPILGICRGNQMINVALGGTLYQHMPDIRPEWTLHRRPDVTDGYVHNVEIMNPGIFPMNKGRTMRVNSMHHQAVDRLAPGLQVTAATSDGLIEGVTLPDYRYINGIQWHPECLAESDAIQADIFSSIINASGK